MQIQRKKFFVEAPDHELAPEANQTRVASQETTRSRVTAASSQEAAATVPRKKAFQAGEKPKPPASQTEPEAIDPTKLPFEFADQRFSDVVHVQLAEACSRKNGLDVIYSYPWCRS